MFGKRYKHRKSDDSFYRAMGPVILVGQCFGLLPITGVLQQNHAYLKFQWINIRTILSLVNIMTGFLFAGTALHSIIRDGIHLRNIVGVIFFVCCTTVFLLFLRLANKWRPIMQKWYRYEESFISKRLYPLVGLPLQIKIHCLSMIIFLMAVVEHILYNISIWYNMYFYTKTCNLIIEDWWKYFFVNHFLFMFKFLPYHIIVTLYLEYSNFSLTVAWNYMDLFIMLISIGISTRFKQMNRRLKMMCDKIWPEQCWEEIRCDFSQLCELVEFIDGHMAPIILLSCTNNLYFICFQLLNIFNSLPHAINILYFWFSLLYLIGRTIFVYLCAAEIHDASKLPLEMLRTIPSNGWCDDLDRFSDQVRNGMNALSGGNFFFMTRTLLFGIVGTVVTYELVLLQFDEKDSSGDPGNSTNRSFCHEY